jgi:hypothetical protein
MTAMSFSIGNVMTILGIQVWIAADIVSGGLGKLMPKDDRLAVASLAALWGSCQLIGIFLQRYGG